MNTRIRTGFALAGLLALTAGLVMAQPAEGKKGRKGPEGGRPHMTESGMHPGGMEGGGEAGMWRMLLKDPEVREKIKLNAGQAESIDSALNTQEKFLVQKRAEVQTARIDLRAEMQKDRIDRKKVEVLAEKISSASAEIQKSTLLTAADILTLLTPAQRKQLEELQAERRKEMMKHFRKSR